MTVNRPLFLVTRSWHGTGGMQRYSKDLVRECSRAWTGGVIAAYPRIKGVLGWIDVAARSCMHAWRLRGTHPFIHLCDASLLPLGIVLARIAGGRLSMTACGLDVVYPRWWYQRMLRRSVAHVQRIVCISHATADALVQRGGQASRIAIIPCGTDDHISVRSVDAPGTHMLMSVGRLVPRKGIAWFVEHVFPLVLRAYPDMRYTIVGNGPQEAHIRSLIHRCGLDHAVTLHTHCTDAQRDELLLQASALVMPTVPVPGDMEGFGIVCIEAAVHGIPVVAARLDGLQDAVLEGQTGRFFEPLNAHDCVRIVTSLFQEPLPPQSVARSARDAYGWSTVLPRFLSHVCSD